VQGKTKKYMFKAILIMRQDIVHVQLIKLNSVKVHVPDTITRELQLQMRAQCQSPRRDENCTDSFHFQNDYVSFGFLVEPIPYILLGNQPHARAYTETVSFLCTLLITG